MRFAGAVERPELQVSKGFLGIGYLAGTGFAMIGALLLAAWLYAPDVEATVALLSGTIPAAALAASLYWLPSFDLSGEQIWTVALWGGLGITVLTALNTALLLAHYLFVPVLDRTVSLLISNVTAGGVAGVLVGVTVERDRDARLAAQRNSVLNRVLRHDLRNDMNVIMGRADLLAEEVEGGEEHVDAIRRKASEVVTIAEAVRTLDSGLAETRSGGVDAAAVVRRQADRLQDVYPSARIRTDVPAEAPVEAGDLLGAAVGQVIENAIVHNDAESPVVDIAVSSRGDRVEILVDDDGPGIPESERYPLERAEETPLEHTSGLGLWLVKWLTDHYDGDVRFEASAEGTTVRLSVPGVRSGQAVDAATDSLRLPNAGWAGHRGSGND